MFKCEACNKSAEFPTRVVTERKMIDHLKTDVPRGPRGGRGSQIVREMMVCNECLPKVVEAPVERGEPAETARITVNGVSVEYDNEEAA